jgi:hypothetical protein
VSLERALKRSFRQLMRVNARPLRRVRRRPQRRRVFPTLLPQPGQRGITRERLRQWRQAPRSGRRRWWDRWRLRERWYWLLCRWAGHMKGRPNKRKRPNGRAFVGSHWLGRQLTVWAPSLCLRSPLCFYYNKRPHLYPRGLWGLQRGLRWRHSSRLETAATALALPGLRRRWDSGLVRGWRPRDIRRPQPPGLRRSRRPRRPRRRRWGLRRGRRCRRHPFQRLNQRFRGLRDRRRIPRALRRWLGSLERRDRRLLRRRLPASLGLGRQKRRRRKPMHLNMRLTPHHRNRHLRGRRRQRRYRRELRRR